MRLFIKLIKKSFSLIHALVNHEGYARWIGVNMGKNIRIYGNSFIMFGEEPWVITLGNNLRE